MARDLIKTAFAEEMVETFVIDETVVDDLYRRGGEPPWVPPDWLESYRDMYRNHFEYQKIAVRDATALVNRMIEAGKWPAPGLLRQIIRAGDAVIEPLHDLLRAIPRVPPKLYALGHAIGLLGDLRRPESVPELSNIVENYQSDLCEKAASALTDFGTPGFEALVSLCVNTAITGTQRTVALDAAVEAAGDDPTRRSRLGEVARPMLDHAIAVAREKRKSDESDDDHPDRARTIEDVAIVVDALAKIADPLARDTITMAFDEGLVNEHIITRRDFEGHYDTTRSLPGEFNTQSWLDAYCVDYKINAELNAPAAPAPTTRAKYGYQDRYNEGDPPPGTPAPVPIVNSGPRTGRNDPCWCGSGKKYKKCHLGKESTT